MDKRWLASREELWLRNVVTPFLRIKASDTIARVKAGDIVYPHGLLPTLDDLSSNFIDRSEVPGHRCALCGRHFEFQEGGTRLHIGGATGPDRWQTFDDDIPAALAVLAALPPIDKDAAPH